MTEQVLKYYRVATPAVQAAWETYAAENAVLDAQASQFAAMFDNAVPVYVRSLHGREFRGLRFDPAMPTDVWTVPDKKSGRVQRPRARLAGSACRDRIVQLKAVQDTYDAHRPKAKSDFEPVLQAIGTHWGDLLFNAFGMAWRDGVLYVATTAPLSTDCVEINGSEYDNATKDPV